MSTIIEIGLAVGALTLQTLDGHELMPCLPCALVALAYGLFEVFAEHGLLRLPFPTI